LRPSSDLPTHLVLYRAFPKIGGVAHTHSEYATAWAQAQRELLCLDTTHVDHFHGPVPVTRMAARALLIPPGFPDFMSRARVVHPGPVLLEGRAWSGLAPVEHVEVSVDGGDTWAPAVVEGAGEHRWAWRRWTFIWQATVGRYTLSARAADAEGRTQPVTQAWNRGGFGNNEVQLVPVVCFE